MQKVPRRNQINTENTKAAAATSNLIATNLNQYIQIVSNKRSLDLVLHRTQQPNSQTNKMVRGKREACIQYHILHVHRFIIDYS